MRLNRRSRTGRRTSSASGSLPGRRVAAARRGGRRRAAAPADAARQRGRRGRARAADAGPDRTRRATWLGRAAERYRESFAGRAARTAGAGRSARSRRCSSPATGPAPSEAARWALDAGAATRQSRRSAATPAALALLVLGGDARGARARRRAPQRATTSRPTSATRSPSLAARGRGRLRRGDRVACSSRSRRATSTSRTCRSPTPCSCCRRSPARRGLAAELELAAAACVLARSPRSAGASTDRDHDRRSASGPRARAARSTNSCDRARRALLGRDPHGHLRAAERALGAVLGPAALDLVEHRRAQVARRARRRAAPARRGRVRATAR